MKKRVFGMGVILLLLTGSAAAEGPVFYPLELYINSGDRPLAAYQIEFVFDSNTISLVGVEGGKAPFHKTPYYDPAGFKSDRVVFAAYTGALEPPVGRVHVITVHILRKARAESKPVVKLIIAAGPDGKKQEAVLEALAKGGGSMQ